MIYYYLIDCLVRLVFDDLRCGDVANLVVLLCLIVCMLM